MSKLTFLVGHCSATPEGRNISSKDIHNWHIIGRGWSRVGYRDMIHLDGELENLIKFDTDNIIDPWEISNGVKGYNGVAAHFVYVGGCDKKMQPKDTRTTDQLDTMEIYIKYMVKRHPEILVAGHNQFANRACPSFDMPTYCRLIGIPEKNIYKG